MQQGELFIWTDVNPDFEQDFNQWYDKEHMEERASIPGFLWSRRYRSVHGKRPYLALYRTVGLDVFTSEPYLNIFNNQTDWSRQCFERMMHTKRRVMAVEPLGGEGTGSHLGLLELDSSNKLSKAQQLTDFLSGSTGVLSHRVLMPDAELSTPLPSESREDAGLNPILIIECTDESTASLIVRKCAHELGLEMQNTQVFNLLWELRSQDLA